jgi:uncharacterized repeat protein (TIGR02543 family)
MKRFKIGVFCLFLICGFIGTSQMVSAYNYDIAMHETDLETTNITISDFISNQYVVNVSALMSNVSVELSPDNYYVGYVEITNDKSYDAVIENIGTYGKLKKSASPVEDYGTVLDEWFYYSFAIDSKGINIPDTPINQFDGASLVYADPYVSSEGGMVDFGDSVTLAPGESITMYYDFSFSWESDNRTMNMGCELSFTMNLKAATNYQIDTSVTNGTIDESVNEIASGTNKTIKYTANNGYVLDKVIVDGIEQDIEVYPSSYTFNNITANHTINVVYKPENYAITYNLAGGINDTNNPTSYSYGTGTTQLSQPTKDGYVFSGWCVDYANTALTDMTTPTKTYGVPNDVTGNVVLSAIWEAIDYNITYDYDEGIVPIIANPSGYDVEDTFPIAIDNIPTRDGYEFIGWTVNYENTSLTDITTPTINYSVPEGTTGNIIVTAHWAFIYDISYDYVGGVASTMTNRTQYDEEDAFPLPINNVPIRVGYEFVGWVVDYDNVNLIDITTATKNYSIPEGTSGNITLTAVWKANSYVLDFDLNDSALPSPNATGKPEDQILDFDTTAIKPMDPTKEGYTFVGWYEDAKGTTPWNFDSNTMSASNKTLYAKWIHNTSINVPVNAPTNASNTMTEEVQTSDMSYMGIYMIGILVSGLYILLRKRRSKYMIFKKQW